MKKNNDNRILAFDIIRSLCVIYIVAVWHLNAYLSPNLRFTGYTLAILHNLTISVLGVFTLLSGILLSKYEFGNSSSVWFFYKKRLGRFFILLLLSALSYWVLGWISVKQLVQVLLGMNLFIGPSVPTLWFFSMMVFFYLITPIFNLRRNHLVVSLIVVAILFIGLVVAVHYGSDIRLLYYFPMYILGLYIGPEKFLHFIRSKFVFLLPLSLLLFIPDVHWTIAEIAGAILIVFCGRFSVPSKASQCIRFISVSSMIAYLFHRQFFGGFLRVSEATGRGYIPLIIAVILVAVLFVVSYFAQNLYDNIFRKR